VSTPGLQSVYSGHDHGDAWCANWPNVAGIVNNGSTPHVCFCKHTGYGGYGNVSNISLCSLSRVPYFTGQEYV
jgi:hypothetical protein